MRHVVFRLDKDRYALPLAAIREVVVTPEKFSRVPRSAPSVRGIMNLRGRVVTVVELATLLRPDQPEKKHEGPPRKIVLLDRGRRELGLLVTEVDGIEAIEKVGPAPPKAPATVKGLARLGALAVTVLEPEALDAAVAASFSKISRS
ncbi:MAG: chemotaxis protein CheW [Myxococcaceae bacterium]|nr:chemotaxis protein CheW [Myxococcaceae bacterium]